MMSSEEEESEKSCKVKPKRVRQRVDAGEPRNSYAAIPNFTSRPGIFFNGYGFGLVGGRPLKELDSMAVDVVGNGLGAYLNGEDLYKRDSPESAQLLRDILQQGRKVFGEEERGVSPCSEPPCSPVLSHLMKGSVSGGHGSEAGDGSSLPPPPGAKEDDERMSDDGGDTPKPIRPVGSSLEVKRARVETIVSNMMPVRCPTSAASSPVTPVNGCKKRKLYQPQQHDTGRLLDDELTDGDGDSSGDGGESPPKQRRQERESLKVQLQQMQEQLATMQQRYLQLFEQPAAESAEEGQKAATPSSPCKDSAPSSPPGRGGPSESERQSCIIKSSPNSCSDLEWLVDSLKSELSSTLTQVIDAIIGRYVQRRGARSESEGPVQVPPHPLREVNLLSQMLDRKSPRTKVIDRGGRVNGHGPMMQRLSPFPENCLKLPLFYPPGLKPPTSLFCTPTQALPGSGVAVPFSQALPSVIGSPVNTTVVTTTTHVPPEMPEQTEAMSLVVTPKKKRHKVTDTRITPRTVSRVMGQEGGSPFFASLPPQESMSFLQGHPPPPPLVPVSLPTSVAIPNPSLNQSDLYASLHYDHHRLSQYMQDLSDDDQLNNHSPAMLPPPQHGSPDTPTPHPYIGGNFLKQENGDGSDAGDSSQPYDSSMAMTSTLTPMHLRKAKLMFFYVRYPSSAILKMYFPDIKFNKNNTAQLVKWFSNFREFFYIQMEKYARQSISDGTKSVDELKVSHDSELLRVLNLHYNRNNHIEVPENFRYVIESTLREFFKAILGAKDQEQSWKKAIYKVIARMDDTVPEYFKSPNFLEQLE